MRSNTGWPFGLFFLLIALLLQASLHARQANASPVLAIPGDISKRYTGDIAGQIDPTDSSPAVSDFPNDDQIRSNFRTPSASSFVFWTEIDAGDGGSPRAREFARQIGGVTIYDVYPRNFICENMGDPSWWNNYVDRVSGIYVDHITTSDTIYLVTSRIDGLEDPCTVFHRVERLSLVERGFSRITYVNAADFADRRSYSLLSNEPQVAERDITNATTSAVALQRRAQTGHQGYCFNWLGYGDDPKGSCSPKNLLPKYSGPTCGAHIVQYEKNIFGQARWNFNVTLKDSNGERTAAQDLVIVGAKKVFNLFGRLPKTFVLTPGLHGTKNTDPLRLQYGAWDVFTDDSACSVGGYTDDIIGYRQMDCGFPCPYPS